VTDAAGGTVKFVTQFIAGGLDVTGGAVAVIEALLVIDCSASSRLIAFSGVANSH
jgi:hypothetical protein